MVFMDLAPHNMALRFYSGTVALSMIATPGGKKAHLLSLPYYLVSQIEHYMQWFEHEIQEN